MKVSIKFKLQISRKYLSKNYKLKIKSTRLWIDIVILDFTILHIYLYPMFFFLKKKLLEKKFRKKSYDYSDMKFLYIKKIKIIFTFCSVDNFDLTFLQMETFDFFL